MLGLAARRRARARGGASAPSTGRAEDADRTRRHVVRLAADPVGRRRPAHRQATSDRDPLVRRRRAAVPAVPGRVRRRCGRHGAGGRRAGQRGARRPRPDDRRRRGRRAARARRSSRRRPLPAGARARRRSPRRRRSTHAAARAGIGRRGRRPSTRATAMPAVALRGEGETWTAARDLLDSDRFAPEFVVETEDGGPRAAALRRRRARPAARRPARRSPCAYRARQRRGRQRRRRGAVPRWSSRSTGVTVRNPLPAQRRRRSGADPPGAARRAAGVPHAGARGHRGRLRRGRAAASRTCSARRPRAAGPAAGTRCSSPSTGAAARPSTPAFEAELRGFLERFRMAGYDLEIDGPRFVPLDVALTICVEPGHDAAVVEAGAARRARRRRAGRTGDRRLLPPGQLHVRPAGVPQPDHRRASRRSPGVERVVSVDALPARRASRRAARSSRASWRSTGWRSRGSTTIRATPRTARSTFTSRGGAAMSELDTAVAASRRSTPRRACTTRPGCSELRYPRRRRTARCMRRMLARAADASVETAPGEVAHPLARSDHPHARRSGHRARSMPGPASATCSRFYQERIANEGFLRTATERRSILELARLIGYELNPGVAASAYLAFRSTPRRGAPRGVVRRAPARRCRACPDRTSCRRRSRPGRASPHGAEWNALRPRLMRPQQLAINGDDAVPARRWARAAIDADDDVSARPGRAAAGQRHGGRSAEVDTVYVAGHVDQPPIRATSCSSPGGDRRPADDHHRGDGHGGAAIEDDDAANRTRVELRGVRRRRPSHYADVQTGLFARGDRAQRSRCASSVDSVVVGQAWRASCSARGCRCRAGARASAVDYIYQRVSQPPPGAGARRPGRCSPCGPRVGLLRPQRAGVRLSLTDRAQRAVPRLGRRAVDLDRAR